VIVEINESWAWLDRLAGELDGDFVQAALEPEECPAPQSTRTSELNAENAKKR
jgi:hypothetical protein